MSVENPRGLPLGSFNLAAFSPPVAEVRRTGRVLTRGCSGRKLLHSCFQQVGAPCSWREDQKARARHEVRAFWYPACANIDLPLEAGPNQGEVRRSPVQRGPPFAFLGLVLTGPWQLDLLPDSLPPATLQEQRQPHHRREQDQQGRTVGAGGYRLVRQAGEARGEQHRGSQGREGGSVHHHGSGATFTQGARDVKGWHGPTG